jgi:hypothetical protein
MKQEALRIFIIALVLILSDPASAASKIKGATVE